MPIDIHNNASIIVNKSLLSIKVYYIIIINDNWIKCKNERCGYDGNR